MDLLHGIEANVTSFFLPTEELFRRQQAVRAELARQGLWGAVFFNPYRILYLSNFAHLSTERPIAFILPVEGEPGMIVPKLEEQHCSVQAPWLKNLRVYFEYPGLEHPICTLANLLKEMGLGSGRLGVDFDGHLDQFGYQGTALSAVLGSPVVQVGQTVNRLRLVKSAYEIELLRQSGEWASRTHRLLQQGIRPGLSERAISHAAEDAALDLLEEQAGEQGHYGAVGLHASFRSGPRTAISHASMGNRKVEIGDNLVSYTQGCVSGYYTELERTMFMGEPTAKQREMFCIVREAQALELELLKPGTRCAEVDEKVRAFFISRGYGDFMQHHQGHGLGIEWHEAPFLDRGDVTVLQTGMVFSVEPGLYLVGVGGFRHSDTVLLTDHGVDMLTPYPSNLEYMVIN